MEEGWRAERGKREGAVYIRAAWGSLVAVPGSRDVAGRLQYDVIAQRGTAVGLERWIWRGGAPRHG